VPRRGPAPHVGHVPDDALVTRGVEGSEDDGRDVPVFHGRRALGGQSSRRDRVSPLQVSLADSSSTLTPPSKFQLIVTSAWSSNGSACT
jgi:hypothetical protein